MTSSSSQPGKRPISLVREANPLDGLVMMNNGLISYVSVDDKFKRLGDKMSMLQRSFSQLHRKMNYSLRINVFCHISRDDSKGEKNSADKKRNTFVILIQFLILNTFYFNSITLKKLI